MEPMVRHARPRSWNRRNRQETVWNRPESKSEPETFELGSKWNRNWVEPKSAETTQTNVNNIIILSTKHIGRLIEVWAESNL